MRLIQVIRSHRSRDSPEQSLDPARHASQCLFWSSTSLQVHRRCRIRHSPQGVIRVEYMRSPCRVREQIILTDWWAGGKSETTRSYLVPEARSSFHPYGSRRNPIYLMIDGSIVSERGFHGIYTMARGYKIIPGSVGPCAGQSFVSTCLRSSSSPDAVKVYPFPYIPLVIHH